VLLGEHTDEVLSEARCSRQVSQELSINAGRKGRKRDPRVAEGVEAVSLRRR